MDLLEHIKQLAASERYSLTSLAKAYNEKYNTNMTQQSFDRKIRTNALKYTEYIQILDLLGYTLDIRKK